MRQSLVEIRTTKGWAWSGIFPAYPEKALVEKSALSDEKLQPEVRQILALTTDDHFASEGQNPIIIADVTVGLVRVTSAKEYRWPA